MSCVPGAGYKGPRYGTGEGSTSWGEFPWLTCLEIDIKLKLQNLAGIS